MRKITQRQTDEKFMGFASDLYDKFVENAAILYADLFPEKCSNKTFDHSCYDMIRDRLMLEFSVLFNEAKGEKNAKNKCKKAKLESEKSSIDDRIGG